MARRAAALPGSPAPSGTDRLVVRAGSGPTPSATSAAPDTSELGVACTGLDLLRWARPPPGITSDCSRWSRAADARLRSPRFPLASAGVRSQGLSGTEPGGGSPDTAAFPPPAPRCPRSGSGSGAGSARARAGGRGSEGRRAGGRQNRGRSAAAARGGRGSVGSSASGAPHQGPSPKPHSNCCLNWTHEGAQLKALRTRIPAALDERLVPSF